MNQQPIEKQHLDPRGRLDVHSVFLTIQGEGPFTGRRAIFVRLAGCNLQCPGCDTEYTEGRELWDWDALVMKIRAMTNDEPYLVVITGGEPLRQNIIPLCAELVNLGYSVQVETNGTLYLDLPQDVIVVCSPKTGKFNEQLAGRIDFLKYVVKAGDIDPKDGLPLHALGHSCGSEGVAKPATAEPILVYIQPMDEQDEGKNRVNLEAAMAGVMKHGYTLCLQTHKIIGAE